MALHSSASTPRALAQGHSRRPSVAVSSAASRNPSDSKSKSVRAPSAYNLYVKEHYQTVSARLKAKGLPADLTTVGKHLRQEWSALSDREKAPYNARSQKLKEEIGVGSRGSSPTRLQAVARPSSAVPARPVSPGPARPVSPGRPSSPAPSTKPLPPYEAFITEQFPAVKASHPNATPAEITRLIDEMWQRVPQAQKDAKAARYKVELQAHMNGTPASNGASRSASPQRSSSYSYTPAAPRAASPAPRAASPRPQSPRPTGPSNERPLPPQEAFAKEQYQVIKATYPKASENEINRMISDMWGKLPQSLKDAKAKRYESDLAAYNATGGSSASRTSSYSPAASRTSSPAARAASPAPRVGSPRPQSPRPTGPSNEKPLPPFEAFSKEQYLVIKASHPKSSDSEINRLIDELWQRVPQSQKDAKAKRYEAELAAYNASSGGSSRASYSSYSPAASRTSSPARAASPATRTASPRPQSPRPTGPSNERPLPPQEAFAKEQYQVIKATYPKASDSEINRMISDMWGKLPQSLKDAKAKRYDSDLAAYNQSQGGARYSPSSSPRTSTVNVRRSPVGAGRR